jgi:hypothetical protein
VRIRNQTPPESGDEFHSLKRQPSAVVPTDPAFSRNLKSSALAGGVLTKDKSLA